MEGVITKEKYRIVEIAYRQNIIFVNSKGKRFKTIIPYFVSKDSEFFKAVNLARDNNDEVKLIMLNNVVIGIKSCSSRKSTPVYIENKDISTINMLDDSSFVQSAHRVFVCAKIKTMNIPYNVKVWLYRLANDVNSSINFAYNMSIAYIAINLINNGLNPSEIGDMKKFILSNRKPTPLMVSLGYGKVNVSILYNALKFANIYMGLKTESSILDVSYFNPYVTDWQFSKRLNAKKIKEEYSYMDFIDMINSKK